jgi:hypothetical protein
MRDDILPLPESKDSVDNLSRTLSPKEQASLADKHIARKTSHHSGKTLLEQCMEEFERYLFMARTADRARA